MDKAVCGAVCGKRTARASLFPLPGKAKIATQSLHKPTQQLWLLPDATRGSSVTASQRPRTFDLKGVIKVVGGIIVTALFVYVLYGAVDVDKVKHAISGIQIGWLVGALGFLTAAYVLKIARWFVMLRGLSSDISYRLCVAPFMISIALNNVLPMRAGDVVRVVAFRSRLGASGMALLGTMIVERVLDLVVLLAVFGLAVRFLPDGLVPPAIQSGFSILMMVIPTAAVAVLLLPGPLRLLLSKIGTSVPALSGLVGKIDETLAAMAILCRPARLASLLGLSLGAWACEGGVFVLTAVALGWTGGLASSFFALAVGTLSTLLPSSPGYVGTFHYFTTEALTVFGADRNLAAAFAIVVHLVLVGTTAIVGLAFLLVNSLGGASPTVAALPETSNHN